MSAARMTPEEARAHLDRLGLSQQALARLIRVNPVTVRRWLKTDGTALDIPRAVEIMLDLLTPAKVKALLKADQEPPGT